jgi:hypothetical protein
VPSNIITWSNGNCPRSAKPQAAGSPFNFDPTAELKINSIFTLTPGNYQIKVKVRNNKENYPGFFSAYTNTSQTSVSPMAFEANLLVAEMPNTATKPLLANDMQASDYVPWCGGVLDPLDYTYTFTSQNNTACQAITAEIKCWDWAGIQIGMPTGTTYNCIDPSGNNVPIQNPFALVPFINITATGNYTFTVSNSVGCKKDFVIYFNYSKPISVTGTAFPKCIDPLGPPIGSITCSSPNIGALYSINGGPFSTISNWNNLGVGQYFIVAKDAGSSCTSYTTLYIGNIFTTDVSVVNGCLKPDQPTDLMAINTPIVSFGNYGGGWNFTSNIPCVICPVGTQVFTGWVGYENPNINNLFYTGGAPSIFENMPGSYTFTASDGFGCTASTEIIIYKEPVINLLKNQYCLSPIEPTYVTADVTLGSGNFEYDIDNGPHVFNNTFAISDNLPHIITVTDITTGCSSQATIELTPCVRCEHYDLSNPKWILNPTTDDLYDLITNSPGADIMIDGVLVINKPLILQPGQNLYFMRDSWAFILDDFKASNTNIKGCDLWYGMTDRIADGEAYYRAAYQYDSIQKLLNPSLPYPNHLDFGVSTFSVKNFNLTNSYIEGMNHFGIFLNEFENVTIDGNLFDNNDKNLILSLHDVLGASRSIKGNSFFGKSNFNSSAIELLNMKEIEIGGATPTEGNFIKNFANGIVISYLPKFQLYSHFACNYSQYYNKFYWLATGYGTGGNIFDIHHNDIIKSDIKINSNVFENIHKDFSATIQNTKDRNALDKIYQSYWVSNYSCAQDDYGAAIFLNNQFDKENLTFNYLTYNNPFPIPNINVGNTSITNCDVGILNMDSKLSANKMTISNSLMGIMNYKKCHPYAWADNSQPFRLSNKLPNLDIYDNTITDCHIGIQVNNDMDICTYPYTSVVAGTFLPNSAISEDNITNNIITTRNFGITDAHGLINSPIGISYIQPSTTNTTAGLTQSNYGPNFLIGGPLFYYNIFLKANQINLKYKTGIGIDLNNLRQFTTVYNNKVNFLSADVSAIANHTLNGLIGIRNNNTLGVLINENYVNGYNPIGNTQLQNESVLNARESFGYYIEGNSKDFKLSCNKAKYTQNGIYGYGINWTDPLNIKHNKFNANLYPLYFQADAIGAHFGRIGSSTVDNGNEWVFTNGVGNTKIDLRVPPKKYSVFRNSSVPIPFQYIYTNSSRLISSESGGLLATTYYPVSNITMANYIDPCDPNYNLRISNNASQTKIINNDDEFENEILIATDAYTYEDTTGLAKWINEKRLFEKLSNNPNLRDSISIFNSFYNNHLNSDYYKILEIKTQIIQAMQILDTVKNRSSALISALIEQHKLNGNSIQIENQNIANEMLVKHHFNALTESDNIKIDILANSCPFIAGDAVYEVRYYNQKLHPDAYYNVNQICKQVARQDNNNKIINNIIKVYPNPANREIFVEFNCDSDGDFEILNTIGKVVFSSKLRSNNQKIVLNLPHLSNGVYLYKCIFKNCPTQTGKLIINQN